MTPKPKDPNPSGLGRAIINRKIKDAHQQKSGLYSSDPGSSIRLKSVTQERDLDEFFSNAQLAGTDFTAERRNVKIIQQTANGDQNPFLLSEQEKNKTLEKHAENKQRLRVPRRPPWRKSMDVEQLDRQEKAAFLDWRRELAQLQEEENILLTPFERNLEVWRQLWRVLERSHLVVQIVDARNPLHFRCEDLEAYVRDLEGPEGEEGSGAGGRVNLLLINKADLLTSHQRLLWAAYFDSQNIHYAFFSAASASVLQEAQRARSDAAEEMRGSDVDGHPTDSTADSEDEPSNHSQTSSQDEAYFSAEDTRHENEDSRIRVFSVSELETWFHKMSRLSVLEEQSQVLPQKLVVGLVGYPNVGKSSTINALLGEKKVSVSSTPGKTKHFQTIHLSDSIVLCDCPGLVFPQFAMTKADLVCDGVLPIDQLREHTAPTALVVKRIPKDVLEVTYGLSIQASGADEGGDMIITAENLLIAYAIARGYMRSGQGNPDEARAARYILKDYVNAKLLFCHPPPGVSAKSFNEFTHERARVRGAGKKRAPVTRVGKGADTFVSIQPLPGSPGVPMEGKKSRAVDEDFFQDNSPVSSQPFIQSSLRHKEAFTRTTMYPHQTLLADDGTPLNNKPITIAQGKKHHRKTKRTKQRSGKGYD